MANPPLNKSSIDAFISQSAAPKPAQELTQQDSGAEVRPMFREKPSTEKMSVNMPKDLYEALRAYMKLTDISMSEVIVEGARRELARRKRGGE
ncbi:hypothetical protein [Caballeronia sp. NCTM1]|uniref:hypothetical protein n=1 Tax=Caballeronia sp. NCTM1 TaxID=2921753 RepID=UPI002027EEF5|nr:hypothetical protein [Caballeronia sp. NCTM1]